MNSQLAILACLFELQDVDAPLAHALAPQQAHNVQGNVEAVRASNAHIHYLDELVLEIPHGLVTVLGRREERWVACQMRVGGVYRPEELEAAWASPTAVFDGLVQRGSHVTPVGRALGHLPPQEPGHVRGLELNGAGKQTFVLFAVGVLWPQFRARRQEDFEYLIVRASEVIIHPVRRPSPPPPLPMEVIAARYSRVQGPGEGSAVEPRQAPWLGGKAKIMLRQPEAYVFSEIRVWPRHSKLTPCIRTSNLIVEVNGLIPPTFVAAMFRAVNGCWITLQVGIRIGTVKIHISTISEADNTVTPLTDTLIHELDKLQNPGVLVTLGVELGQICGSCLRPWGLLPEPEVQLRVFLTEYFEPESRFVEAMFFRGDLLVDYSTANQVIERRACGGEGEPVAARGEALLYQEHKLGW
ncbi:hypothetical protein PG993_011358 [Apiospora rasikravindrae]|uniref:Uncharacterized protein n=1 Tax=Apiospora rasikravindrae TaxID=990691 RepID=A0ABR1SDZ5_9PEZI